MADIPKKLQETTPPEEVGAEHGEATGVWRILRNGVGLAIVGVAIVWLLAT
jgi:hypothetical protein